MSCSSMCYPECGVTRPSPVSGSCNEPCVRQCPDSEVIIRPSPVVVTIPGPILSNFPQQSRVGDCTVMGSFTVMGDWVVTGGGYGGLGRYGGLCDYGGYGHRYHGGYCGPC
uniref:Keratin n=1 Tax=Chrysemys picta bellii TaxID=8478 RepID=A0A8C3INK8_CHRPI